MLAVALSTAAAQSYTQISHETGDFYGISMAWVDMLYTLYMIAMLPAYLPSCWVMDTYGLRAGILLACTLQCAGIWLRCLATSGHTFFVLFIGQILAAAAQPLLYNAPATLSQVWFPEAERPLATVLGVAAQFVGGMGGGLVPPLLIPDEDSNDNATDPLRFSEGFRSLHLGSAAAVSVPLLLAVFFVPIAPKSPPSAAADTKPLLSKTSRPLLKEITTVLRNPAFLLLLACTAVGSGAFQILGTLRDQIVTPYGYTNEESGRMNAIMLASGLIGCIVGGRVARTHRFKTLLVVADVGGCVSLAGFWFFLREGCLYELYGVCVCIGFFALAGYPVAMELAVELSFPVDASVAGGLVVMAGQAVGAAAVFPCQALVDRGHYRLVAAIVAGLLGLGALFAALIGGLKAPQYKRREYERLMK